MCKPCDLKGYFTLLSVRLGKTERDLNNIVVNFEDMLQYCDDELEGNMRNNIIDIKSYFEETAAMVGGFKQLIDQ